MDILELLEEVVYMLIYWRIVVVACLAGLIGWLLSVRFAAFTAPWCIGCVLIGILLGIVWQRRAERRRPSYTSLL